MAILTGPGENNLQWWSPIKQNNKPFDVVKAGMLRRLEDNFKNGKLPCKRIQVVQFYENNALIDKKTLNWT